MFGNSLHQPEYKLVKRDLNRAYKKTKFSRHLTKKSIRGCGGNCRENGGENGCAHCRVGAKTPDPNTLDTKLKNLLILDDCYLGKQSKAQSYYTRGRHRSCDYIYIFQLREKCAFIQPTPEERLVRLQ